MAEKNAFHLLRNRDYEGAAALFLLPQPPSLELCLDVLVRHVKDPGSFFFCVLKKRIVYAWGEGKGLFERTDKRRPPNQPTTPPTDLALLVARLAEADMHGGRVAGAGEGAVGPVTRRLLEQDIVPWAR